MTLGEAIKHAEEVADSHDRIKQIKAVTLEECRCAEEHRQLAEWLKELKQLREQPKTGWIPISERLPEDSGEYLVSVIDKEDEDYKRIGVAWFAHPKDYDIKDGEWRELMFDEKVIAWMPLLTPYESQESEVSNG